MSVRQAQRGPDRIKEVPVGCSARLGELAVCFQMGGPPAPQTRGQPVKRGSLDSAGHARRGRLAPGGSQASGGPNVREHKYAEAVADRAGRETRVKKAGAGRSSAKAPQAMIYRGHLDVPAVRVPLADRALS